MSISYNLHASGGFVSFEYFWSARAPGTCVSGEKQVPARTSAPIQLVTQEKGAFQHLKGTLSYV